MRKVVIHTPRDRFGVLRVDQAFAGSPDTPEGGPDNRVQALSHWGLDDWETFLDLGMNPDGDFVGGEMRSVIADGTAALGEDDLAAMARYLLGVKPRKSRRDGAVRQQDEEEEEPWM